MANEIDVIVVGEQGPAGPGVPAGGTTGQFLKKNSDANFDADWTDSTASVDSINDANDVVVLTPSNGDVLTWNDSTQQWENVAPISGVTDHGQLTGLSDDDHIQYHNDVRGDARYYRQVQVDALVNEKADLSHTHVKADITDFSDADYATAAQGLLANTALQDITGESIQGLFDVSTMTPTEGQVLTYQSGSWTAVDAAGSASWGDIAGTLSNQTDLQAVLDTKADSSHTHVKADITDFSDGDYAVAPTTNTIQTTGTTPTTLVSIPVPNGEQRVGVIAIRGFEPATGDMIWKYMRIGAKTISNVTSVVGGVSTDLGYDIGATAWDISHSTSSGNINIVVTGEAGKTINWSANAEIK